MSYFSLFWAVIGHLLEGCKKFACQTASVFCFPYNSLEGASMRWKSICMMPNVEGVSTNNNCLAFFSHRLTENLLSLSLHMKNHTGPEKKSKLPLVGAGTSGVVMTEKHCHSRATHWTGAKYPVTILGKSFFLVVKTQMTKIWLQDYSF